MTSRMAAMNSYLPEVVDVELGAHGVQPRHPSQQVGSVRRASLRRRLRRSFRRRAGPGAEVLAIVPPA